uniref:Uncharacterized protein n=1 Tax=Physcomitrium patens TaxID=3218 RepID=A0A2K1KML7_PHYPA|nr:hypothetical protein PHYPA_005904 [Physcomitrium patens]
MTAGRALLVGRLDEVVSILQVESTQSPHEHRHGWRLIQLLQLSASLHQTKLNYSLEYTREGYGVTISGIGSIRC